MPGKNPIHTKKFDRAVQHIKQAGKVDNPYAVAQAALGKQAIHASHRVDKAASPPPTGTPKTPKEDPASKQAEATLEHDLAAQAGAEEKTPAQANAEIERSAKPDLQQWLAKADEPDADDDERKQKMLDQRVEEDEQGGKEVLAIQNRGEKEEKSMSSDPQHVQTSRPGEADANVDQPGDLTNKVAKGPQPTAPTMDDPTHIEHTRVGPEDQITDGEPDADDAPAAAVAATKVAKARPTGQPSVTGGQGKQPVSQPGQPGEPTAKVRAIGPDRPNTNTKQMPTGNTVPRGSAPQKQPPGAVPQPKTAQDARGGQPEPVSALAKGMAFQPAGGGGGAGPGSKGGHVIGTTKSGKPIYQAKDAGPGGNAHLSHEEHSDAATLHEGYAKFHASQAADAKERMTRRDPKHWREVAAEQYKHHSAQVPHHELQAAHHRAAMADAAPKAAPKGAGTNTMDTKKSEGDMSGLKGWLQKAGAIPGAEDITSSPNMGAAPQLENTRSGSGQTAGIPGASDSSGGHAPNEIPTGLPSMEPGEGTNGDDLAAAASDEIGAGKPGPNGPGKLEGIPETADAQASAAATQMLSKDDPEFGKIDQGEPGIEAEVFDFKGNAQMDVGSLTEDESGEIVKGDLTNVSRPVGTIDETNAAYEKARRAWHIQKGADVLAGLGVAALQAEQQASPQATLFKAANGAIYSDGEDVQIDAMLKAGEGYYNGGQAPTLNRGAPIGSSRLCKSCNGHTPEILTKCVQCGVTHGAGLAEQQQGAQGPLAKAMPALPLRATVEQDMFLPYGVTIEPTK